MQHIKIDLIPLIQALLERWPFWEPTIHPVLLATPEGRTEMTGLRIELWHYSRTRNITKVYPLDSIDLLINSGGSQGESCAAINFIMAHLANDVDFLDKQFSELEKSYPVYVVEMSDGTKTEIHAINEHTARYRAGRLCRRNGPLPVSIRLKEVEVAK